MPDYISPFAFVISRIIGATTLFWVTGLLTTSEKIDKKDLPRFITAAFFGVAFNQSLFLNGLNITSPIDASIIMTGVPILVLIVSRILLREPITLFKIFGIFLGATGALLLILYGADTNVRTSSALGNFMIVGNATSYAIYLVIAKPLLDKYRPMTVMKWIFLFGFFMVSAPGIPALLKTEWTGMPVEIIYSILFVIVGSTFLAYLLNNISLKIAKPITVGIYIYSQPVIASIVAMVIGQDVLTLIKIISALLVFAGVYFVSYSSSRAKKLKPDVRG
jgi:drug/metabolite transporter (DMT)-like permease